MLPRAEDSVFGRNAEETDSNLWVLWSPFKSVRSPLIPQCVWQNNLYWDHAWKDLTTVRIDLNLPRRNIVSRFSGISCLYKERTIYIASGFVRRIYPKSTKFIRASELQTSERKSSLGESWRNWLALVSDWEMPKSRFGGKTREKRADVGGDISLLCWHGTYNLSSYVCYSARVHSRFFFRGYPPYRACFRWWWSIGWFWSLPTLVSRRLIQVVQSLTAKQISYFDQKAKEA